MRLFLPWLQAYSSLPPEDRLVLGVLRVSFMNASAEAFGSWTVLVSWGPWSFSVVPASQYLGVFSEVKIMGLTVVWNHVGQCET
jgi:hypothetical protein